MNIVDEISERVIALASKKGRSDIVLRHELGSLRGLTAQQRTRISRTVFAFYRWFGWRDSKRPIFSQLRRALELADEFAARPANLADDELMARAVPEWIHH